MRFFTTFVLVICTSALSFSLLPAGTGSEDGAAVIDEVWRIARDNFLDPDMNGADWAGARRKYAQKAAQAATPDELAAVINLMLGELGTSHTAYYHPGQVEFHHLRDIFRRAFLERGSKTPPRGTTGSTGIGIFTRMIEGKRFVTGVIEGTPAHRAGLLVGDEIVSAGGERFEPVLSFDGKEGEAVRLEIRRAAETEELITMNVLPRFLSPSKMFLDAIDKSARLIDRDGVKVGYVRIWSYAGPDNHRRLLDTLQAEMLRDADALVIDIRGGWGGARPDYLNVFNRNVPVMTMVGRNGEKRSFDRQWRKPVVLLVDGETRSGKEIIAYGFKKHEVGPLVGSRTAGAVVFGKPFLLSNGALLYLANADVLVDGVRLEGTGVAPDIEVPFDVRYAAGTDPQLEEAIKAAAGLHCPPPR